MLSSPAKHAAPEIQKAPFKVRPARRGDTDALSALVKELGYPGGIDTQIMNWVISHPEMEIFVAADNQDRAIGMVTLSHRPQLRMKGRIATIDELVVTAGWRRRGVGLALLQRAIDRAKVLSVKRLELMTHGLSDELPVEFFERLGLEPSDAVVLRLTDVDFMRLS